MENIKCNICGNENNEFFLAVPDCIENSLIYQLVRCAKCDLTFVNPRPKDIDIRKYYPDDNYYAYRDIKRRGLAAKLRQKVRSYLMEWAGGYRPANHCLRKVRILDGLVRKVLKNHLIGVVPAKYYGKLLDVGCGNGELLLWYQNHGWETMGIEPSKRGAMIARSKGLQIIESTVEEATLPDNYFDAITMVQVLEHLKDPKESLSKMYRALRSRGLILAGVPNFLCVDRQVLGSFWLPLEIPRHLYHFTPKSLQKVFEAGGFDILEIRRKTNYAMTLSQIKEIHRGKSAFRDSLNVAYLLASPVIKLLTPKNYSSSFISIFATKRQHTEIGH